MHIHCVAESMAGCFDDCEPVVPCLARLREAAHCLRAQLNSSSTVLSCVRMSQKLVDASSTSVRAQYPLAHGHV